MKKTFLVLFVSLLGVASSDAADARWWKGNLHTHSFWSDGDDFPEMIAEFYKNNGYHFLAITDHNILHNEEKWMPVNKTRSRDIAYEKYLQRWGADWVVSEKRGAKNELHIRLKQLAEYRGRIEKPGRYLLIQSEEISARYLTAPIHMNAANIQYKITPATGKGVVDVLQKNIDLVLEQEKKTGKPMLPHVNHPNFRWAITAEELMRIRGGQFFEVYNGHPMVMNRGDKTHANTEKVWDIINTRRLTELKLPLMLGLATDDSHNYHSRDVKKSITLRGWVMVRAASLETDALINAMKKGDFYASSGVVLSDVKVGKRSYVVNVKPEAGVTYEIQFIGTRKGFDAKNEPIRNAAGEKLRITHRYSDDIGAVLKKVSGSRAKYEFKGDELFVRAKVISSKPQKDPIAEGDLETAWTQPVIPGL